MTSFLSGRRKDDFRGNAAAREETSIEGRPQKNIPGSRCKVQQPGALRGQVQESGDRIDPVTQNDSSSLGGARAEVNKQQASKRWNFPHRDERRMSPR